MKKRWLVPLISLSAVAVMPAATPTLLKIDDLTRLHAVGDVQVSPDGSRIAYGVENSDRPGRPYTQTWIMDVPGKHKILLGGAEGGTSNARWSPGGDRIAYVGRSDETTGLMVARSDGSGATLLAPISDTNHPLPRTGERLVWSPDGKQIAFVSAAPGPEADASGDPIVITRYLYKPTASEGRTRFNDNKRLHIFVVDLDSRQVKPLTSGAFYEHSLDWSPSGDEILFISNREADPDRVFNNDVFAIRTNRTAACGGSPTRRAPSTARAGRRTGSASPSWQRRARSRRRKRRWRIRTCG